VNAWYTGTVRHRRFAPRRHAFTYPVCMALLDLDSLEEAMGASRLLGFNRFAWASYYDRDHLGDPSRPLRERLEASARSQGLDFPRGRAAILTNLRYLGYCFNPVSYVYAWDEAGNLALIGAEVTSTPWKERTLYWMRPGAAGRAHRFDLAKRMHVSPFMPMDLRYRWTFLAPGDALRVRMALSRGTDFLFDADLCLERRDWTPAEIRRALLGFPLHTFKVIAAIHWEALKLWLKRMPVFTRPNVSTPEPAPVSSPSRPRA
jgi:uncharacterized protein